MPKPDRSSQSETLIDALQPPAGASAIVIGHNTLETLCGLLRCGCPSAAEMRPDQPVRSSLEPVQLAVLPDPASPSDAAAAVALAGRAVRAGGQIAVRKPPSVAHALLVRLLTAQGFVGITTRRTSAGALILGRRGAAATGA
jgi:hypothetical protein